MKWKGKKYQSCMFWLVLVILVQVVVFYKQNGVFAEEMDAADMFIRENKLRIQGNEDPLSEVYRYVKGYIAVRKNERTFCGNDNICKEGFDGVIVSRRLAEGNCAEAAEGVFEVEDACQKRNNCNEIFHPALKQICFGYAEGDINQTRAGIVRWLTIQNPGVVDVGYSNLEIVEDVATYQGFAHNGNRLVCERYSSMLKGKRLYLCQALFNQESAEQTLDDILTDLAYFRLSIQTGNKDLCQYITNNNVKKGCFSSQAEEFFETSLTSSPLPGEDSILTKL